MGFDLGHTISSLSKLALRTKRKIDKNKNDISKQELEKEPLNRHKKISKYSVEEATSKLYNALSSHTDWTFLKGQKCLKKSVEDLIFQIDFSYSKWNRSYERVEIGCEFRIWCKKFDKQFNIKSAVGHYTLKSEQTNWWDISDEKNLTLAIEQLVKQLDEIVLPIYKSFAEDFSKGIDLLLDKENFDKFHIAFRFLDVYAGREAIIPLAKEYMKSLSDEMKQDIEKYKKGDRSKVWMINPSNLKYIIDNNII